VETAKEPAEAPAVEAAVETAKEPAEAPAGEVGGEESKADKPES